MSANVAVVSRRRLKAAPSVTVGLPAPVVVVLALLAGGLQVVNVAVLNLSTALHAGIGIIIVFVVGLGVSPLVGDAFRNALHLPAWAFTLIAALLSAATLAVTVLPMSTSLHTIILTVITVLAGLGFAPDVPAPPVIAPPV